MNDKGHEVLQTTGLIASALLLGLLTAWFALNMERPDPDARTLNAIPVEQGAGSR